MREIIVNDESGSVVRAIEEDGRLRFHITRQYENRHTEFRLSGKALTDFTEFLVDSPAEQPQKRRGPGRPRKTEAA